MSQSGERYPILVSSCLNLVGVQNRGSCVWDVRSGVGNTGFELRLVINLGLLSIIMVISFNQKHILVFKN